MHGLVSLSGYLAALLLVAISSLICEVLRPLLVPVNMVMVYLLAVVLAASRLGLKPAILTALLSVLAFDFLFVPPRFSFRVTDAEYLVTFFGLFVVGVVISSLVAQIKEKIDLIRKQEARTSSLYHLTRELTAAIDIPAVAGALQRAVQRNLGIRMALLLEQEESLKTAIGAEIFQDINGVEIARWVMRSGRSAGTGTAAFSENPFLFFPLKASGSVRGVMVLEGHSTMMDENQLLLEAFAGQAAMAMERIRFSRQAEQAQILQARENLERALLNSISHDLRTPLSSVTGVLTSLREEGAHLSDAARRELLETACSEAERLNRFVGNLLDMTRIEAGAIRLNFEPCDVQDLVGCALAALEPRIGSREISFKMLPVMPLVPMDMVLMTQVLVNLLDNAHKYSPPGSAIEVTAQTEENWLVLEVLDRGPGVPEQDLKRVFDKFYRIPVPEGAGGTGLGLSICKGIVEAHGGRISAGNRVGGGLRIEIRLPLSAGEGMRNDA